MTLTVLTAVVGSWEAPLVSGLERSAQDVQVVRRCADLGELLSAAAAGLGRAVVLSADLQRLDRAAIAQLVAAGVAVVGLAAPDDEGAPGRLVNIGVQRVLSADAAISEIAQAVSDAVAELADNPAPARHATLGVADPAAAATILPPGPMTGLAWVERPPGRLIAVWGPAGSPGRTTTAITLAAELAVAGRATLLVDADTYGATVAQSLGLLDESAGLAAAARAANQGTLTIERLAGLAPPVFGGLRVLTGLPQSRRWPELRAAALDEVWRLARGLAAWTVVDTGFSLEADEELMFDTAAPRRNGATLSALAAADLILVVGAAEPIGLQRLMSGLRELAEVVPASPVKVVVTRVRDGAVGSGASGVIRSAMARYSGVDDPVLVPDDRAALDAAMLAGRSLTEHAPASVARRVMAELAAEIAAGLGEEAPPQPRRRRSGWRGRGAGRIRRGA
jgi:MinD-like ATPase involved in chromosome partitioning or flagellar assembly